LVGDGGPRSLRLRSRNANRTTPKRSVTLAWGSTSTGRGKLVARKLVAATWTRDNWTHATIGRDENWTRENNYKVEYSLRESVSAQGCECREFDSDAGRKKKAIFYLVIRHWSLSNELVIMPLIDL
jgi:hypothetical protein